MNKVKTFRDDLFYDLERDINKWADDHKNYKIISSSINQTARGNYIAMITF